MQIEMKLSDLKRALASEKHFIDIRGEMYSRHSMLQNAVRAGLYGDDKRLVGLRSKIKPVEYYPSKEDKREVSRRRFLYSAAKMGMGAAALTLLQKYPAEAFMPNIFQDTSVEAAVPTGELRIKPPTLTNPTITAVTTDGGNIALPSSGDIMIQWPGTPVTQPLRLQRPNPPATATGHAISLGGQIAANKLYNPTTMKLLAGPNAGNPSGYACSVNCGFTGATGGEWALMLATTDVGGVGLPLLTGIPFDIRGPALRDMINDFFGVNACFTVEPVSGVDNQNGGPWYFVPNETIHLGSVQVHSSSLTTLLGAPSLTPRIRVSVATGVGIIPQNIPASHIFHIEGLFVGRLNNTSESHDAMNGWSVFRDAQMNLVNCGLWGLWHTFNNDWIHSDGCQALSGPPKIFMENCDFLSNQSTGFIDQPREAPFTDNPPTNPKVANLYDRWVANCIFQSIHTAMKTSFCIHVEADVLTNACDITCFNWVLDQTRPSYSQLVNEDGTINNAQPIQRYWNRFTTSEVTTPQCPGVSPRGGGYWPSPPGLVTKPAVKQPLRVDPNLNKCGLNYISPGYTGEDYPAVTMRVDGTTVVGGGC